MNPSLQSTDPGEWARTKEQEFFSKTGQDLLNYRSEITKAVQSLERKLANTQAAAAQGEAQTQQMASQMASGAPMMQSSQVIGGDIRDPRQQPTQQLMAQRFQQQTGNDGPPGAHMVGVHAPPPGAQKTAAPRIAKNTAAASQMAQQGQYQGQSNPGQALPSHQYQQANMSAQQHPQQQQGHLAHHQMAQQPQQYQQGMPQQRQVQGTVPLNSSGYLQSQNQMPPNQAAMQQQMQRQMPGSAPAQRQVAMQQGAIPSSMPGSQPKQPARMVPVPQGTQPQGYAQQNLQGAPHYANQQQFGGGAHPSQPSQFPQQPQPQQYGQVGQQPQVSGASSTIKFPAKAAGMASQAAGMASMGQGMPSHPGFRPGVAPNNAAAPVGTTPLQPRPPTGAHPTAAPMPHQQQPFGGGGGSQSLQIPAIPPDNTPQMSLMRTWEMLYKLVASDPRKGSPTFRQMAAQFEVRSGVDPQQDLSPEAYQELLGQHEIRWKRYMQNKAQAQAAQAAQQAGQAQAMQNNMGLNGAPPLTTSQGLPQPGAPKQGTQPIAQNQYPQHGATQPPAYMNPAQTRQAAPVAASNAKLPTPGPPGSNSAPVKAPAKVPIAGRPAAAMPGAATNAPMPSMNSQPAATVGSAASVATSVAQPGVVRPNMPGATSSPNTAPTQTAPAAVATSSSPAPQPPPPPPPPALTPALLEESRSTLLKLLSSIKEPQRVRTIALRVKESLAGVPPAPLPDLALYLPQSPWWERKKRKTHGDDTLSADEHLIFAGIKSLKKTKLQKSENAADIAVHSLPMTVVWDVEDPIAIAQRELQMIREVIIQASSGDHLLKVERTHGDSDLFIVAPIVAPFSSVTSSSSPPASSTISNGDRMEVTEPPSPNDPASSSVPRGYPHSEHCAHSSTNNSCCVPKLFVDIRSPHKTFLPPSNQASSVQRFAPTFSVSGCRFSSTFSCVLKRMEQYSYELSTIRYVALVMDSWKSWLRALFSIEAELRQPCFHGIQVRESVRHTKTARSGTSTTVETGLSFTLPQSSLPPLFLVIPLDYPCSHIQIIGVDTQDSASKERFFKALTALPERSLPEILHTWMTFCPVQ